MFSFAIVILFLNPESLQYRQEIAGTIKTASQMAKGRYLGSCIKTGMTGRQVKAILGEPTSMSNFTWQSARIYNYCFLRYDDVGVRVTLYAENRLIWADRPFPFPEDWEVRGVDFFEPIASKGK
jgi:hypothetical protein